MAPFIGSAATWIGNALRIIVVALALPFVFLALIAARILKRGEDGKLDWSPERFADCLDTRVSDEPEWMEWDLFCCCQMRDPALEALRQQAIDIDDSAISTDGPTYLSGAGIAQLQQLAAEARKLATGLHSADTDQARRSRPETGLSEPAP